MQRDSQSSPGQGIDRASFSTILRRHARERGERAAFLTCDRRVTWAQYDQLADRAAMRLQALGIAPGDVVAVWLPDGPEVHAVMLGVERAGAVVLGLGLRSGARELAHLAALAQAKLLVCSDEPPRAVSLPWIAGSDLLAEPHLLGRGGGGPNSELACEGARDASDLWLLNSTSGTTGLPKCVRHRQARWVAFHELAVRAADLTPGDVFCSAVPTPFGFGIWTSHVTPLLLGAPVALAERFEPDALLTLIAQHRVSVLAVVTTQLILLLEALDRSRVDLARLRVVFTGGELVPEARARAFEERTGAAVLQFYGSNETGAVSGTSLRDAREQRLRTSGRPIEEMKLRLFDETGNDVTASRRGRPGVKGPTLSDGYLGDDAANAALIRPDGWMLLGDVVELDETGYLRVVGRAEDFIIRGGQNISAAAVEMALEGHPAVLRAAAVAMPDPVFGERVCAFVELRAGAALDLPGLRTHLEAQGASKALWPERLECLDALPCNAGGKIAKGELRERAKQLAAPVAEPDRRSASEPA
jgi:acyl-CoA synthetase